MPTHTIGIDCRLGGMAHAGIGRYTAELVKRVIRSTHPYRWVLFCSSTEQAQELIGSQTPDTVSVILAPIRQYTLREQLTLPKIFTQAHLDVLHVPHFNVPVRYTGKYVVTIHDLLWHEYTGARVTTLSPLLYWPKYWAYRYITRKAIEQSSAILVPTAAVATTLSRYYPSARDKVQITPEGVGTELARATATENRPQREKHRLLYVGSLYPHKNISLVLKALAALPEYKLEIVGARSVFLDRVAAEVTHHKLNSRVSFLGKLSDVALATHYKTATALVQPSLSEGFGLTGLEALAFRTPLLASDIPVFHEVYQDAAVYFSPHSVESFIHAVRELESPQVQKAITTAAPQVVAQYSWERMTAQTIAVYQKTLGEL